ncbi:cobalamin-dependent protein [Ensifer aridi]|uniref:cobalamin-dependent protein n=1 Tax=Ensifer aridi TaxID=1708715 RepID=UPI00111C6DAD|nr:cobalamin-dependent protein [Ensifer aridi]
MKTLLPEPDLPHGADLLAEGRALARDWSVGPSAFLRHVGVASEYDFKRTRMAARRVMQHAQIGYRDTAKSCRAYAEIWEACAARGVTVHRYGLCLDWSMAVPRAHRARAERGTGMILPGVEDFVRLANAAPVAAHFGDFVLGFPAALENTQAALAAGSTAIGNLGQYFTFRVPGHDDDVEATAQTVRAIGLIAAQAVPVMVHSNLDDGFAAQFTDLTSCLGMILIERHIVTGLTGAPIGHCYGHHFSDPLGRLAFQRAMAMVGAAPGTVIYGNTTAYRGLPAANFASLANYVLVDAAGQISQPTGHAINAVPVTENERIPEIEEVVAAQLFAGRMAEMAPGWLGMLDPVPVEALAAQIVAGGQAFARATLLGLEEAGVDTGCAFQMLLALRRMGARRLEAAYGAGRPDPAAPGGREPIAPATILSEIAEMADHALLGHRSVTKSSSDLTGLRVMVATSDVHEHGKMLVEEILRRLGVTVLDGGVSTDPGVLAKRVREQKPDAVAISTYNGIALRYFQALRTEGIKIPILIGGRLNQIPEGSNTSLPVDVGAELAEAGAIVCRNAADLAPALQNLTGFHP